jgi:hypothetical protein
MELQQQQQCGYQDPMFQAPGFVNGQTIPCNSHGHCISNITGECICDDGWTTFGDFRSSEFKELCTSHVQVITGMYSIAAISNMLVAMYAIIFLYNRFQDTTARWADTKILGALNLIASSSFIILSIRRATSIDSTIGNDFTATFFYSLGISTFWQSLAMNVLIFFKVHASVIKFHRNEHSRDIMKRLKIQLGIIAVSITVLTFVCPFVMYAGSKQQVQFYISQLIVTATSVVEIVFIGSIAVPYVANAMDKVLSEVLTSGAAGNNNGPSTEVKEQMQTVRDKIRAFKRRTFMNGVINATLLPLISFWPFATASAHSYWLSFSLSIALPFQMYQQMKLSVPVRKHSHESNNNNLLSSGGAGNKSKTVSPDGGA